VKSFVLRFWEDERGQSTTEYILILSVVVMIAMKFKGAFGERLKAITDKLGGDIDRVVSEDS
jgi:Flp pilus assembly pilin Flp